jgi:hypothetical protein
MANSVEGYLCVCLNLSSLVVLILCRIDPQVPSCIFAEPVFLDVLVLLPCGGLMLTPHVPLVKDELPLVYEILCVTVCPPIQCYCHDFKPIFAAAYCR